MHFQDQSLRYGDTGRNSLSRIPNYSPVLVTGFYFGQGHGSCKATKDKARKG